MVPRTLPQELHTARLVLRGHASEDFIEYHRLWSDPDVIRHISPRPATESEAWHRLMRQVGHWYLLGFGYWVIEEKRSRRFVGEVGFGDFMRDVSPPIHGMAEMGWVLQSWSHGQGFATEAVQGALAWAQAHVTRPIICLIAHENLRSRRVAEKVGFGPPESVRLGDAQVGLLRYQGRQVP